jgi:hypothetical protein
MTAMSARRQAGTETWPGPGGAIPQTLPEVAEVAGAGPQEDTCATCPRPHQGPRRRTYSAAYRPTAAHCPTAARCSTLPCTQTAAGSLLRRRLRRPPALHHAPVLHRQLLGGLPSLWAV